MTKEQLEELGLGCSSHSCHFVKPIGMGTNGPCNCFSRSGFHKSLIPSALEILPLYLKLKKEIEELSIKKDVI